MKIENLVSKFRTRSFEIQRTARVRPAAAHQHPTIIAPAGMISMATTDTDGTETGNDFFKRVSQVF